MLSVRDEEQDPDCGSKDNGSCNFQERWYMRFSLDSPVTLIFGDHVCTYQSILSVVSFSLYMITIIAQKKRERKVGIAYLKGLCYCKTRKIFEMESRYLLERRKVWENQIYEKK